MNRVEVYWTGEHFVAKLVGGAGRYSAEGATYAEAVEALAEQLREHPTSKAEAEVVEAIDRSWAGQKAKALGTRVEVEAGS